MRIRKGAAHPFWRGGRVVDSRGYVLLHMPQHPQANANGYVLEHRLVMERHIGRLLRRDEHVHHRNENRADNRIENLEVVSRAEHNRIHKSAPGWSFGHGSCRRCGTTDRPHTAHGLCRPCYRSQYVPAQWSRQHLACVVCGTTERRHASHGVCYGCYQVARPDRGSKSLA